MYSIGGKIYSVAEVDYLKKPKGDGGVRTMFDIYADVEDPIAYVQMSMDADGSGEVATFSYDGSLTKSANKLGARAVLGIL